MSTPSDPRDVSPQWERDLLLDFAVTEIHLALALVSAARAAYRHGQVAIGDDARGRAQKLLSKGSLLSKKLAVDGDDRLNLHLDNLRGSLDGLNSVKR